MVSNRLSASDQQPGGNQVFALADLRNGLRLVLPDNDVQSILGRYDGEIDEPELEGVFRSVRRQLRWRRLTRFTNTDHPPPALAPSTFQPLDPPILLSLHLGSEIPAPILSRISGLSPDQVGHDLAQGRLHILADATPCEYEITRLGRYRDSALSLDDARELSGHIRTCTACNNILRSFQALDRQLIDAIDDPGAPIDIARSLARSDARWTSSSLLGIGSVAVVLMVILFMLVAPSDRLGGESPSIPLGPVEAESKHDGWLISSNVDGLSAINLDNGLQRTLVETERTSGQPPAILVSPSQNRIATWDYSIERRVATTVQILDIAGTVESTWRFDVDGSPGRLVAWLNDTELLFTLPPGQEPGETPEEYVARQAQENQLLAINIKTREQRTLFTGSVTIVTPSPDGSMVAMFRVYQSDESDVLGRTMEIRPVLSSGLGKAIAVAEERYPLESTRPIWSKDSQRLYFTRLADPASGGRSGPWIDEREERVQIAYYNRTGDLTILNENPAAERIRLLGVSPDADTVLFLQSQGGDSSKWNLRGWYESTGEVKTLAEALASPYFYSSVATWLPDGETAIVTDARTHYLHRETDALSVQLGATRFLRVDEDGAVDIYSTHFGVWGVDAWAEQTLLWVPEETFSDRSVKSIQALDRSFSLPRPVDRGHTRHTTREWSAVNPGGDFVTMFEAGLDVPTLYGFEQAAGRLLASPETPIDLSWSPGGESVIGVINNPAGTNMLGIYATHASRGTNTFDFRTIDPASINADSNRRYAQPLISPTGNQTTFFVINEVEHRIQLLASMNGQTNPRIVDSWDVAPDAWLDEQIGAVWTGDHDLVYTVPSDWQDGAPQKVELRRVYISDELVGEPTTAVSFRSRGTSDAVAVRELALSSDRSYLAARIRQYRGQEADSADDSIRIIPVFNPDESFEVRRGDAGEGLQWSTDRNILAYITGNRLEVASPEGQIRTSQPIGHAMPRHLVWVSSNQIWLTAGTTTNPELLQVDVR